MSTPERKLPYTAVDDDVELAKALRENAQRERVASQVTMQTEIRPLWERIQYRRTQNSFGEEYDLSITPRRSA